MSIKRQWSGMLAMCAQILIWERVSGDKTPGGLISRCTLRLGHLIVLKVSRPEVFAQCDCTRWQQAAGERIDTG